MSGEPGALGLILTSNCNLRCSYCYQNSKTRGRMEWRTLRAALDGLLESVRPELAVFFLGGEPLLELSLIRRAVAYVEGEVTADQKVTYRVSSNGTLLDDEAVEFFVAHRFELQLSFDGVAEAQDVRGLGTFTVLDRRLGRLLERHPGYSDRYLTVAMTLVPRAILHLSASVEYFLAKGVCNLTLAPDLTLSAGWDEGAHVALADQFDRLCDLSLRHWSRTARVPLLLLRGEPRARSPGPPRGLPMCSAGRHGRALLVDVDGELCPCPLLATSYREHQSDFLRRRLAPLRLGRLGSPELSSRLASLPEAVKGAEIFDHKERKYSSYGRCADCPYLGGCVICPVSIGHIPGNQDPHRVPDFLCAFNRLAAECRERFRRESGILGPVPAVDPLKRIELFVEGVREEGHR